MGILPSRWALCFAAMLEGNKLQTLLAETAQGAKPRLFLLDLWEPYKSYAHLINKAKDRVQHAGRGLFYKRCVDHGGRYALL